MTMTDTSGGGQAATHPAPATKAADAELAQNGVTEPAKPKDHYFLVADGEGGFRKVNAWGEEKGSAEDKKRW
jgi:hypothetical protein